jgi:hypothetical protein
MLDDRLARLLTGVGLLTVTDVERAGLAGDAVQPFQVGEQQVRPLGGGSAAGKADQQRRRIEFASSSP